MSDRPEPPTGVPKWGLNEVLVTKVVVYEIFLAYINSTGNLASRVNLFSLTLQLSEGHIQMPESAPPYLM